MSKKLDETLNLRSMDEINELEKISESLDDVDMDNINLEESKVDPDITEHVDEMNEVYQSAMKAHKEILDLGYSVDTKYAGNILSTSAKFLDIAISASSSKIDKKLKKLKMDMDAYGAKIAAKNSSEEVTIVDGKEVVVSEEEGGELLNRNDILSKIDSILKNPVLTKPSKTGKSK